MKLWCNGFQGFKKILETNNWNDSNLPDNAVFISICCTETDNSSYETHLLSDNHDNVINLDFDDINGLNEYQNHPDHKEFGRFICTVRKSRACIDFEI